MSRKYELLDESIEVDGFTLHRIRALRDIPGVAKEGELGGFVQDERNLSHEGRCWISEQARVMGNAQVLHSAHVRGNVVVTGDAEVAGSAFIDQDATIKDRAYVGGRASVGEKALLCDEAIISGHALITDRARVGGSASVMGIARVRGSAVIGDDAKLYGNCTIQGSVVVLGDAMISGSVFLGGREIVGSNAVLTDSSHLLAFQDPANPTRHLSIYPDSEGNLHYCRLGESDRLQNKVTRATDGFYTASLASDYLHIVEYATVWFNKRLQNGGALHKRN